MPLPPDPAPPIVLQLLDVPASGGGPSEVVVHRDRAVVGRGPGRGYDVEIAGSPGSNGAWHIVRTGSTYRLEPAGGAVEAWLGASRVRAAIDLLAGDVVAFGSADTPFRVRFVPGESPSAAVRIRPPRPAPPPPAPPARETAVRVRRPFLRSLADAARTPGGAVRLLRQGVRVARAITRPGKWVAGLVTRVARTPGRAWVRAIPLALGLCAALGAAGYGRARAREADVARSQRDQALEERDRWRAAATAPRAEPGTPLERRILAGLRSPLLADDPYYDPEPALLEAIAGHFRKALDSSWFRFLVRSGRGADLVRIAAPRFAGLPEVFMYHALVESAACPFALSTTGARGPWQFTFSTARAMGLEVAEARRDPAWLRDERARIAGIPGGTDYAACDLDSYARSANRQPTDAAAPWFVDPVDPEDPRTDVDRSTEAAARYHRQIWERPEIAGLPDRAERIWFVLAGWNCGPEHVRGGLAGLSERGYRRTFANLWAHDAAGDVRIRCEGETLGHVPRVVGWYLAAKVARGEIPETTP